MTDDSIRRRQFLKGALAGGVTGAVAGCSGRTSSARVRLIRGPASDGVAISAPETFESIQAAVNVAEPGDTVSVPSGTYHEKVTTTRSGTEANPITITGPESAVIRGDKDEYGIVRINHSHIRFTGFTVEGLLDPERPEQLSSYVSGQLIQTRPPKTSDAYLRDIVIAPDYVGYSRASLIGLERTVDAEIGPCRVSGLAGASYLVGDEQSHNGELLYIGTAASNLGSNWHPWSDFDETRNVRIHHIDNSEGHAHAEAVDLKEGTENVTVEYLFDRNGGQVATDDTPAAISFKGHESTVRWSTIDDAPIGVDFDGGYPGQAYGNSLYGCEILGFDEAPFIYSKEAVGPHAQGIICGNRIEGDEGLHPRPCPAEVPAGRNGTVGFQTDETTDAGN